MAYYPARTDMPQNLSESEARNFDWDGRYRRWPNAGAAFWRSRTAEAPIMDYDSYPRYRIQERQAKSRECKPKKYWARPVDRRSHGAWGRLMDVLRGDGPDVFIVVKENHRGLHSGPPHCTRWSGWETPKRNVDGTAEYCCHSCELSQNEGGAGARGWVRRRKECNSKTRAYEPARLARNWGSGDSWHRGHW